MYRYFFCRERYWTLSKIYIDFRGIKKFWENSRFYDKKLEKKSGGTKKKSKKFQILWKKLEKYVRVPKKNGDGYIPKEVQILNVSNIVDKKMQILTVSIIVHSNIVDKSIFHIFGEVWKFWVCTYPNVGHSKSGFAHSFPRVE